MKTLWKLTWVEIKLFFREPTTMVFTLALPLLFLFVMGGVFGNNPDPDIYRGFGPTNYYIPAYIGLVISSIGVISLPVHLTGYRERGVLKRFLYDSFTARKARTRTTGNASRGYRSLPSIGTNNLYLEPGERARSNIAI